MYIYYQQKETTATTEFQRQVPTPSSSLPPPNPTISHTGKTGFKQRSSTTSENYAPLSSKRTSTSRKPVDSTTEPTTSTSKKFKSFKDTSVRTTPSFRRSIGSGTEDNRIPSSTTEVRLVCLKSPAEYLHMYNNFLCNFLVYARFFIGNA